jgi:HAD superfamily hydrolase (TIGR01509 family)
MSASEKAVLFDVDGTLVDTNYLHAVTWWQAFAQAGHQVPMTAIHHSVGMGSDYMLDALLPDDRDRSADESIRAAHKALYAPYWPHIRPFDKAADLLRACRNAGLRVVLASSADPDEFAVLRAALDAEDAITAATSAGDVDKSKPAPDLVEVALERAGVPASQAVFVGDTVWDARAAGRAGVPCVAVLSGGISATELAEAGAVAVFPDATALLESTGGQIGTAIRPGADIT